MSGSAERPKDLNRRLTTVTRADEDASPPAGRASGGGSGGSAGGGAGPEDASGDRAEVRKAGLEGVFAKATRDKKTAVAVYSMTDRDRDRREAFGEKDTRLLSNVDRAVWEATLSNFPVAYSCRKGLKPESPNQDSFSLVIVQDEFALYCVYDGHGPNGHCVSDTARWHIPSAFLRLKEEKSVGEAIKEAFRLTQAYLKDLDDVDSSMSGTTCTVAYHDMVAGRLYVGHCGDSRAVISAPGARPGRVAREAVELTRDHKPNLEGERKRIERAGGRVVFDGFYNHRVFSKAGNYPGLNMSRALGDLIGHREAGLSAEPEVAEVDLGRDSGRLLILCTDGVWEFVENAEALGVFVAAQEAAARGTAGGSVAPAPKDLRTHMANLTKMSWDRWMKDSDNEISDDITGIAVVL